MLRLSWLRKWLYHNDPSRIRLPAGFSTLLAVMLLAGGSAARAATFTVTDTSDASPNSLRTAMTLANGSSGNTIAFAIPGGGVQTISLSLAIAQHHPADDD